MDAMSGRPERPEIDAMICMDAMKCIDAITAICDYDDYSPQERAELIAWMQYRYSVFVNKCYIALDIHPDFGGTIGGEGQAPRSH